MELQNTISETIDFILFILPFFVFWILSVFVYKKWVDYAQTKFDAGLKYSLLRIYPPQEVLKTPAAMELFLNALYQAGGESTWYDKKWLGKKRAVFSLEMASHGGEVAFYIRTRSNMRREIETQIYAQYPGIEVEESPDYTDAIDMESGNYNIFGVEYQLAKPDPWPIKTYVDYGLDKVSEEEEKTDPITPTVEFLGSLKAGEHAWIQIIVKAHKKEDKKEGTFFDVQDNWQEEAKELIEDIRSKSEREDSEGNVSFANPTKGQQDQIAAIERSVAKPGFDVGIRSMYIAEKDVFDGVTIGALVGTFKQYGSGSLNGFKPQNTTKTDYPWQTWLGAVPRMEKQMFEDYKSRSFFGTTFNATNLLGMSYKKDRVKFVLNAEELATIFHFPGTVAGTPSLNRVKSRKGEAPANLPIK